MFSLSRPQVDVEPAFACTGGKTRNVGIYFPRFSQTCRSSNVPKFLCNLVTTAVGDSVTISVVIIALFFLKRRVSLKFIPVQVVFFSTLFVAKFACRN